ncbi:ankyrin repeat domain-containing protein 66 [Numida meleagris]|uniref:ankyrin repeat domain-containing protein 66 n=1 Tax=Numida meleagris TaxID=8996 RepID=UPI000B3DECCF|nr:ankyrin repeat domain-containing protein 66 [Numida meleagris]
MSELHEAVAAGHYERAERLLRAGRCDPNQKDADWGDWTPLHWAAARGHVAMLRLLLGRGARPCLRNAAGWTPAHCAAEAGRLAALRTLHAVHAPMDAADPFGDTPRRLAQIYGHAECVSFLETAEVESRAYRRMAAMRGVPLDQVDEDWELKKEELERNPACAWRSRAAASAQKKMERKRRKQ